MYQPGIIKSYKNNATIFLTTFWNLKTIRIHLSVIDFFKIFSVWVIGLVWFDGILTIVGYFMPHPFYTYILKIWFGFGLFYGISTIVGFGISTIVGFGIKYAKSSLYIKYIWFSLVWFCKHKSTKLNSSKYCYVSLTIQLNNSHLFTHS